MYIQVCRLHAITMFKGDHQFEGKWEGVTGSVMREERQGRNAVIKIPSQKIKKNQTNKNSVDY